MGPCAMKLRSMLLALNCCFVILSLWEVLSARAYLSRQSPTITILLPNFTTGIISLSTSPWDRLCTRHRYGQRKFILGVAKRPVAFSTLQVGTTHVLLPLASSARTEMKLATYNDTRRNQPNPKGACHLLVPLLTLFIPQTACWV